MKQISILFILFSLYQSTLGQTHKHDYFSDSKYFDECIIIHYKIKKITVSEFYSFLENQTIYTFNEKGELICSESNSFEKDAPEIISRQTKDCNEYTNGLQTRHLRYRDQKEKPEWIEEFNYEFDKNGNIIEIRTIDHTIPRNSNVETFLYDDENRFIKSITNSGYITEEYYDADDNLIESSWGSDSLDFNTVKYTYDRWKNILTMDYSGVVFDNYSLVGTENQYDKFGRKKSKTLVYASGNKQFETYYYDNDSIIRVETRFSDSDFKNQTIEIYNSELIQSITEKSNNKTYLKKTFEYEFF
ncbi:hypothetical protein [Flammeovirga aprica]|uniref:YD repeat-containing protein n=1 Tax=Flammeovirga aprica JL-4 TaxID=694437 RepID=A0A7X9RZH1_9BACT|nr:hypothetical protein [Flammeovirga aprica]NME71558.1 hypothetical protein [Flammeovirga aprica JL-4]